MAEDQVERRLAAILAADADAALPGPQQAKATLQPAAVPDKPSIAVLPFSNMSNDPEQEFFSDGITEDIITDLSKVSGLSVLSRNAVFTLKGKALNLQQAARIRAGCRA